MKIEQVPSPERSLAERINSALLDHYEEAIDALEKERDDKKELISIDFHDFDKPESVRAFLDKQGIDTTGLEIEAKVDGRSALRPNKGDGSGGDVIMGVHVKISSGGKVIFENFFVSPDDEYSF